MNTDNEKYFCRICKGPRNHQIIHKIERRGEDDDYYFQWFEEFQIIECLGCESISFLHVYGDTEMVHFNKDDGHEFYYKKTIYPEYLELGNELPNAHLLPTVIKEIYRETITAIKVDSRILAAGGLRAVIEATCNELGIKKGSLEQRIDLLSEKGHLSFGEAKRLHSIRFLGNDALHEIETPTKGSIAVLLDIVNHLLSNLFINDKLIQGKVERIIDMYPEFVLLVGSKIKQDKVGKEFTIEELLGKSKRQIPKKLYESFKERFKSEVQIGSHDFVSLIDQIDSNKYRIIKIPDNFFPWHLF